MEIIYDFTTTGGTSIVANCVEFVDDNTTHDVTCPLSFVLYGKESTIPSFVLIYLRLQSLYVSEKRSSYLVGLLSSPAC